MKWFELGWIIAIGLMLVAVAIGFSKYNPEPVAGDDVEDPIGQCIRGNQKICDKIDMRKFYEEMLNRTILWNKEHGNE